MKRQQNQLPQVAFTILLALSLKPRHGYEIIKQVAEDSQGKITLGPGALYTSIKQLSAQGLIVEDSDVQDDRRRYYKLTNKGLRALNEELEYYRMALQLAYERRVILSEAAHV
ncbi:MAG TPA: PadR family transcriptional regulator [Candidatus Saccharimonadales bacterium]|nr:PadR family transcriptional regulator [Candidatus Saccharimonadales bacterium]